MHECKECKKQHSQEAVCEKCKRCLYTVNSKQIPDRNWCIIECECGHRQVWD